MALDAAAQRAFLAFAQRLADASGPAILPHFRRAIAVDDKGAASASVGVYDPVTDADKGAEAAIRALIRAEYPDHGILGEEEGHTAGASPLTWVLDPIDGTRAFISGLPIWGTLIALNDGTRPVIGVIDQPFLRERYSGGPDGADLNGVPIRTRPCADLSRARLMATDPRMFRDGPIRAAFDAVQARVQMSRYGGDCYAYCMLAMGMIDLVIEGSLQAYDVQALIPVVEGAGGLMTSWSGGPCADGGLVVAAGDARVHAQALEILSKAAT